MRKLAIAMALSSTLLATPAFARDGAMYIGGEFGAMIVEDIELDIGAVENAVTINHEYGYDGGIFVGYDFGAFRLEAEAAYKKARMDDYQTTIRLPLEGAFFAASREEGAFERQTDGGLVIVQPRLLVGGFGFEPERAEIVADEDAAVIAIFVVDRDCVFHSTDVEF
ncbi:MAG TPA: hypothetical protein VEA61_12275, partial [Allosphingosinicella sp.]|nr:hypothetical protein [Allosphingosinicella sp.]